MEDEYSNREIDRMFGEIQESLGRIEVQTTKHNGRLTKIEKWMYGVVGAITILGWLYTNNLINLVEAGL